MKAKYLIPGFFLFIVLRFAQAETQVLLPLSSAIQGKTVIVNGKVADGREYPSSFQSGKKNKVCTWFLVGAEALVGAAHCAAGSNQSEPVDDLMWRSGGKDYTAKCTIPDGHWRDSSQDWALCKVDPPVVQSLDSNSDVTGFEVLSIRENAIQDASVIEISGFGCTTQGGAVESEYWIGKAKVAGLPPSVHVTGSTSATPNAIKIRQFPALLCGGDSGGPAFLYQKNNDRIHRVVIGINSSTAINAGVSYLSSTTTAKALSFFRRWAESKGVKICGIHSDYSQCRPFLR